MSIFALRVHDNVLVSLRDEHAVIEACAPADVAAQHWLFFADDGSPLRPEFIEKGGRYFLRPWASCSSCSLPQVLPFVSEVRGEGFAEVAEITRYITTERRRT